jgi:hypothetical protein
VTVSVDFIVQVEGRFSINHFCVIVWGLFDCHSDCILLNYVNIGLIEIVHSFFMDAFIISYGIKHLVPGVRSF